MGYATAVAYFEQLPEGWASFPDCRAHASLLGGGPRGRGAHETLEGLPESLLPILDHASDAAEWLPEVVHVATLLAIRDARFGEGPAEEDAFLRWLAQVNRELLGAPAMAEAFLVPDPIDVLPRLPLVWEKFHRGSPLSVVEASANHARIVLTHPTQLFHRINLESHRRTLALSLAMSSAMQPKVESHSALAGHETGTVFEVSWL